MQGQIACDHLRSGRLPGQFRCKINRERSTNCIGLHSRCECSTLRQCHDRWAPTEAAYKVEAMEVRE